MLVNEATCESKRSRSLQLFGTLFMEFKFSWHHYFIRAEANFHQTISNQFKILLWCFVIFVDKRHKTSDRRNLSFFSRIFSFQMDQQTSNQTSKQFYSPSCLHFCAMVLFTFVVVTIVAAITTTFRDELKSYKVGAQIWFFRLRKAIAFWCQTPSFHHQMCTLFPFRIPHFHTSQRYK